jgi:hypothetical protein
MVIEVPFTGSASGASCSYKLRRNQSRSRCGVGQGLLEVHDPGPQNGRTGHDDDVTRHKTREERPESLTEQPSYAVPDDGAPDATAHTQTNARTVRRLPREMVQDELRPGHTLAGLQRLPKMRPRSESLLASQV